MQENMSKNKKQVTVFWQFHESHKKKSILFMNKQIIHLLLISVCTARIKDLS